MPTITILINPSSASGRTLTLWPLYEQKLVANGYSVTHYITESELDFRKYARAAARKFRSIAICGGDSSLTIAAEELLHSKFKGELIFLPAGSVNDIVLDIAEQNSAQKNIFLGQINCETVSRHFIGQANWGLGVVVNRWVGRILHTLPFFRPLQNLLGALLIILTHLFGREIVTAEIHADDRKISGEYSIILVTQIRHWASGLRFAPSASLIDRAFQIVAVKRCNLLKLIRIILSAKTGEHLDFKEVSSFMASSVVIRLKNPAGAQIDGDILMADRRELKFSEYKLSKKKTGIRLNKL